MYSFIELLRAFAVMLITNSHFDGVYPWNISWGGCPGVALFFAISGFVLVNSVQKENFFSWYLKKIIRLYIPLSIVNFITVFIGYRTPSVQLFLFPITVNLWYVPAITVLYILYYFILKKIGGRYRGVAILLAVLTYTVSYVVRYKDEFFVEPEIGFRLLYGFVSMMIGSILWDYKNSDRVKSKRLMSLFLGIASCGGFLFMKLFLNRVHVLMRFQFMTQVFGVAFAVFMMIAGSGLGYEQKIRELMKTWIGRVFGIISTCSLEIYLVQFAIIGYLKKIVFPINLFLILVTIVAFAYLIHKVSNRICSKIIRK